MAAFCFQPKLSGQRRATMKYGENLNPAVAYAVGHDEGGVGDNELARTADAAGSPDLGMIHERIDALEYA